MVQSEPTQAEGLYITYDGISSETFGLMIGGIDRSKTQTYQGCGDIQINTDKSSVNDNFSVQSVVFTSPLKFDLSLISTKPLSVEEKSSIAKWLIGSNQYKKLKSTRKGMENIYYDAIITNPEWTEINGATYVLKAKVNCRYPYALEEESTVNFSGNSFTFNNESDVDGYMYPVVEITSGSSNIEITNTSDNNATTTIKDIVSGEVLTMNEKAGRFTSSRDISRMGNFNKVFLRMVKGENRITMSGVANVRIKYQNAKLIGGSL